MKLKEWDNFSFYCVKTLKQLNNLKLIEFIKKEIKKHKPHFLCSFLLIFLCLWTLGRWTGESSDEEDESSEDELLDDDDYYSLFFLFTFLSWVGITLIFLMDLLYMSFHHSSFQLVGSFWLLTPSPSPSSLRLICTHSVTPCCFLPRPLPYFQPMLDISFLAYSLSNFLWETPVDWRSFYLYLADMQLINKTKNDYKIYPEGKLFYIGSVV